MLISSNSCPSVEAAIVEMEILASSINRRSSTAVGVVVPLNLLEDERFFVSECWSRLSN